jgi:sigma-E factor negative regulatory protein RseA
MTAEDRDREALSALMDGEAQELELRRVLDSISSDPSLRERWRRQQQVRERLQGQRTHAPDVDVSIRVREVLDTGRSVSRNPMWSVAIAASVTIAVVMGGQQLLTPSAGVSSSPLISDIGGGVVPVMGGAARSGQPGC